jgi:hypothetical protein
MRRNLVQSSSIRSVGYDSKKLILEIEFNSGRIYQYFDVPRSQFKKLCDSTSKGQFFNTSIKGNYPHAQLPDHRPYWRRVSYMQRAKDTFDKV